MINLQDLRTAISSEQGDLFRSTGSGSGGGTYLVDASLAGAYPDGYFRGAELYVLPFFQAFRVLDYAGATGTFTLNGALPGPLVDDQYELRRVWFLADIDRAINDSIRDVGGYHFIPAVDVSLVVVSGQYEYPIPDGWMYLSSIEAGTRLGADHYARLHPRLWRTVPGRKVKLRYETVWRLAGSPLRLTGFREVSPLSGDLDVTTVPAAYIIPAARARLYEARAGGPQTDTDAYRQSATTLRALAEARRGLARTSLPPNTQAVIE
jgi:hypothetical protein